MSRNMPRRSDHPQTGRSAVIGVMLVGLSVGLLTVAGTTPRGLGRLVEDASRVSLDQRTFACIGGIAGSSTRSGDATGGLAEDMAISTRTPARIAAERDVARGAFAAQQASTSASLAWVPCPEPRARWWFVAAGGATTLHDTVVAVDNPRTGAAVIDIDVYGPQGRVESPGLHGITVAAGTTQFFDLARVAPEVGNLAVSVIAKRGLVAVSAADRFSPGVLGSEVREWLPPQSLPAVSVTLAGLPAKPESAVLVLANPGRTEAIAEVSVIGSTGTFVPQGLEPVTVPPESVLTVPLVRVLDGTPMAIRVTASKRVTATVRSVQAGDTAFATGVQAIQGATAFAVPQGAGRLVLSSVANASEVDLVAYDTAGKVLLERPVPVPARSSVAIKLPATVRYVGLVAKSQGVVGGFVVSRGKGVATAGIIPGIQSVVLPAVRQGF